MHNERKRVLQQEISSIPIRGNKSQLSNAVSVPIPVPATAPQPLFSHPNGSPLSHRPVPSSSAGPSAVNHTPSSSFSSSHKSNGHMTVITKPGTSGGSLGGGSPREGSRGGVSRSHIPPPPPPLSYMSVYSGLFGNGGEATTRTTGANNNSMHFHGPSKNKGKTNTPLVTTLMIKRANNIDSAGSQSDR